MSKSSRVARQRAQRAAAALRRDQQRRQRMMLAGGAVATVVLVVVVLVLVKVVGGGSPSAQQTAAPASTEVINAVTGVPASVLEEVGLGSVSTLPKAISDQPALTANGKPLVLYIGAEYCPFCAAQRWPMVVALSRFGIFSNLQTTHSASDDVYPNTPTLSFHGSSYTSQYLEFQGVETQSNVRQGSSYAALDTLTAEQTQVLQTYNAPPYVDASSAGAIPFIDFGNKYLISGASVSPTLMAGMTPEEVAAALSDPSSDLAKAVDGAANAFTAAICQLTGNQPSDVCSSPAVTAYVGKING